MRPGTYLNDASFSVTSDQVVVTELAVAAKLVVAAEQAVCCEWSVGAQALSFFGDFRVSGGRGAGGGPWAAGRGRRAGV